MSGSSTVIIKKPSSLGYNSQKRMEKYTINLIAMLLWGLAALTNSLSPDINSNLTGISLSVRVQDVLVMLMTTYLLAKGLKESKYWLVIPWLLISLYNLYNVQAVGAFNMYKLLRQTKTVNFMPWLAFGSHICGLGIRTILVGRVALLSIHQWYQVKLRETLQARSDS